MIFDEENVSYHLKQIKPDVYVKGGDYDIKRINQEEKQALSEYQAVIKFIPLVKGHSSSEIIRKIKKGNTEDSS